MAVDVETVVRETAELAIALPALADFAPLFPQEPGIELRAIAPLLVDNPDMNADGVVDLIDVQPFVQAIGP